MNATSCEDLIVLTDAAAAEAKKLLGLETEPEKKGLRIFIEQGGCSGMQYGMVFDEKRDNDASAFFGGVPVFVDPVSANYLRGTVIDYKDSLTGGGFKMSNPQAKHSCGCGKSFEA